MTFKVCEEKVLKFFRSASAGREGLNPAQIDFATLEYVQSVNKGARRVRNLEYHTGFIMPGPGAFVSVPFPESYNFFGTGAPQTISALKIRILDPFTNEEAILGPNSSIYLQINKMLTEQAVAQIPN